MCERGKTELVMSGGRQRDVDSCIAPIVRVLNEGGIKTIASCCGHGIRPGNIILEDGRELFIMPDFDCSRELDKLWPPLSFAVSP